MDTEDLRYPEFSYWLDTGQTNGQTQTGMIIELSGCFVNQDYYQHTRLREDYYHATGLQTEPRPDPNIWRRIPGDWNATTGKYEWDLDSLDPPFNSVVGGSVGSSSAGGTGTKSWHPYDRISYAINAHGTVEWNIDNFAIISGGTQCQYDTEAIQYVSRGIAAQDGGGNKLAGIPGYEPFTYSVSTNANFGSCSGYLNSPGWHYLNPGQPSPYWWETMEGHGNAYSVAGNCAIGAAGGGAGTRHRAGENATSSPFGPPSYSAGTGKLDGYLDCGGYSPYEIPPELYDYLPGHGGDNDFGAPNGSDNNPFPFDYYDPPPKEPPVPLPLQPTIKVYLGSSEWQNDLHLGDYAAGEFFSMHPLDITTAEINDPKDPSQNVHPIQAIFDSLNQWLPVFGVNWGNAHDELLSEDPSYDQYLRSEGLPSAKTFFPIKAPNIGESFQSHHLIVLSPRHQIVILKLGAVPLFTSNVGGGQPHFCTQRVALFNVFDGSASLEQLPVEIAQRMYDYYFNEGELIQYLDVNNFRYPEYIQKYLRYNWWFHCGHFEAVLIRVSKNGYAVATSEEAIPDLGQDYNLPNGSIGSAKQQRTYFGTADFINARENRPYNSGGSPFQQVSRTNNEYSGALSRDTAGYVLTAQYRLDLRKLWVCVGVNETKWTRYFGQVAPKISTQKLADTYDSAPWLYIAANWQTLGEARLYFLECDAGINRSASPYWNTSNPQSSSVFWDLKKTAKYCYSNVDLSGIDKSKSFLLAIGAVSSVADLLTPIIPRFEGDFTEDDRLQYLTEDERLNMIESDVDFYEEI